MNIQDQADWLNSIAYSKNPFQHSLSRRKILRAVSIRVMLYKELAARRQNKFIHNPILDFPNLKEQLLPSQEQFLWSVCNGVCQKKQVRRADIQSHYLCRMAFCQNEGLRDYMVKNQTVLFKNKLQQMSNTETLISLYSSMAQIKVRPEILSQEQFKDMLPAIQACKHFVKISSRDQIVKLPFQMAPQAISRREALLIKGIAYFNRLIFQRIIVHKFQENLRKSLTDIVEDVQNYFSQDSQDQLSSFLKQVSDLSFNMDYDFDKMKGKLNAQNVELWRKAYPPCMNYLLENLKSKHHLKHGGRLQLGLFLKGAGLSLEDALIFWRKMFQGSGKNFQKEYYYNIKHNYGKEGARKNYSPMGCQLIIKTSDPKSGEYHGCPFKSIGIYEVKTLLFKNYPLTDEVWSEIQELMKKKHYQVSCKSLFKGICKDAGEQSWNKVGNHPNIFFQQSFKYFQKSAKLKESE